MAPLEHVGAVRKLVGEKDSQLPRAIEVQKE
jgi:hypothetical protein